MFSFKVKLIALLLAFGLFLVVGTVLTNHTMLKNSLIEYVDMRDQQHLERIKKNIQFILDEKLEDDLGFIDEVTWKKIVSISSRVDFTETFVPVDLFLSYPFSDFKQRHPDFAEKRLSLVDVNKKCMFGHPTEGRTLFIPIEHEHRILGYIGYSHRAELTETLDIQLAERQQSLLTYGVLIVVVLSGLLLIPFGHYFLSPIQAVTQGMRDLTAGRFQTRLEVNRQDELGQLQHDFNHLAISLEKNQQSRNQWIADISHELRTPLTILRGEIEAFKDGVRPVNEKNLDNLHSEVLHIHRLVEDLYQIALNDVGGLKYQMLPLEFGLLVKQTLEPFTVAAQQKGLTIDTDFTSMPLRIHGDGDRLQQMISNILSNSIAYTDAPGQIHISLKTQEKTILLTLEDSAPGLPEQALPNLFERFFRGESSRNRRYGGAGIGLALVAQIVQAHQGKITAQPSALGGLYLSIQLPLETYST
ncbi:MAG: ATP-binding protein [Thiomicrospira sp.]|jgi:two-component system sensor histidine kinase BaeS|nr:ATP-binding protein [Thiomicrospira sp.]